MTFVYPLLLGGLVLAGVPVLLHFLVRKKPVTLVFPAYRFLMQKKRSNTRNLRLRHLLLLLLRMLLILLVCFALARPRLFHESMGFLSREKPVALVLIFDTTMSMEYTVGTQSRLDLAKRRALDLLDELPEDCRVVILDAADPDRFGREDWLSSLEKARQRIQGLTIQPTSAPINKALDEAQRRFDVWEPQRMPRFVCIFSDRTRASWEASPSAKRETDAPVLYFDVGVDEPIDLAIVSADLNGTQQTFHEGEKIPLRVVVSATGRSTNEVHVKVGEQLLKQTFTVAAGTPQTLGLEIDARKWGLKPGLHQAEVKLETETDSLPHNNKRFVTFKIDKKPRVLVLADDLKRSERFAFGLKCLHFDPSHKTIADKDVNFSQADAIFLVGVKAPPVQLWLDLAEYVKTGRGVGIIPPGEDMTRPAYHSDAAKKVMPANIVRIVESPGSKWNDGAPDIWGHPFLSLYRKWFIDGDADFIQKPRSATRYWQVEPTDKKGVIVRYDLDGHPAVVERLLSKPGKVLLLTTAMDEQPKAWHDYDENLNSFYLALTLSCVRYLSVEPEGVTLNHQFGQKMPTVTTPLPFPKYLLTSGEFSEEIRFDKDSWSAERLPRAGNYVVSGTNPAEPRTEAIHKFSVNIAPEESDLTRVSVNEIEAALGEKSVIAQDRRRSLVDTLGDRWDEPVELFPWLMILVLLLLAFENLLANLFYRRDRAPAEERGA